MNKADEKRLKADPRYTMILTAHGRLCIEFARAQQIQKEAMRHFEEATGIASPSVPGPISDASIFDVLRPRGDKARVIPIGFAAREGEPVSLEIENVTEQRVRFATRYSEDFDKEHGYYRKRGYGDGARIHPDDLAKIKAGELKGWRQKPWGKP